MKKIFLFILFIIPSLSAQQSDKGNISLVFNGSNINLPIVAVSIIKGNLINLKIVAEQKDSLIQKSVMLDLNIKELSPKPDAEILEGTAIKVYTLDNKTKSGSALMIHFGNNNDKNISHYVVINDGKNSDWEINTVSLSINIIDVKYINGALHLNGECSGIFKSKDVPENQTAEIKDGKFEVII